MAFYNTQGQPISFDDQTMLDEIDDLFTDDMLNFMLDVNMHSMGQFSYPEKKPPTTSNLTCTKVKVFRASDMNTVEPCVNGVQHLSSSQSSPPITPETNHDDNADVDSDCTSCVKCRETASEKRARRREQNRQSQRKFRAKKEANLSDARSRIRDLETLIRAQERTIIELKLTIEKLDSKGTRIDANLRRKAIALAEKHALEMTNHWKAAAAKGNDDGDWSDAPTVERDGHELLQEPAQECISKK